MNFLISKLTNWCTEDYKYASNVKFKRKVKLLLIYNAIISVASLIISLTMLTAPYAHRTPAVPSLIFLFITTLLIPIYIKKTKRVSSAAHFLALLLFIIIIYTPYASGESQAHPLLWLTFINFLIFSVIGRKAGFIWTYISIIGIVGFYLVAINFDFPSHHFTHMEITIIRGTTILVLIIAISVAMASYQKELVDANDKLKQQTELTRSLLRIVVHDIRNPLNAVQGYSEILHEELVKERHIDYLKMIELGTANILDITDHVDKLQGLETGKLKLKMQKTNLNEILDNNMNIFKKILAEKGIELIINCPSNTNLVIEKVTFSNQIISNIISNAIKFSLPNSKIFIKAERQKEFIHISVKDNGIGIPQNMLDDIFIASKFTNRLGTQGEKGTGFGMTTAKAFTDRFNGNIEIISKSVDEHPEDHGTEVIITLPINQNIS